jgi:hypothetical protein
MFIIPGVHTFEHDVVYIQLIMVIQITSKKLDMHVFYTESTLRPPLDLTQPLFPLCLNYLNR